MANQIPKGSKRRLRSSYLSTIISITLVLFMLGLLGLIILNAKKLSDHVKENIGFSIILKEGVKEVETAQIQKLLDAEDYVKSTHYIHPDSAAAMLQEDLGEDFIEFLGYNPLTSSIDVHLHAPYANPDSLSWIESEIVQHNEVKEIFYQKDLVSMVNKNLEKIGLVLLGFATLLMIIAIALINNTIRLAIFSKRFVIKTMQLVGAKHSFIRRPFVMKGIGNGIISALVAIGMLSGLLYLAQKEVPEIMEIQDLQLYASLFIIVIVLGILISWISTNLAVRKYLRIQTGDLY